MKSSKVNARKLMIEAWEILKNLPPGINSLVKVTVIAGPFCPETAELFCPAAELICQSSRPILSNSRANLS